jgi:hypothetical protein
MKRLSVSFVVMLMLASRLHAVSLEWVRQFGATTSNAVSADGLGSVYISGELSGDAFVNRYDSTGNLLWNRQLGATDASFGVSADGLGNVYITGQAGADVFLSKYDTAGNAQWTRQFGSSGSDSGYGVSADGLGNVFVSGFTAGSLGGPHVGPGGTWDAFVGKYDSRGNQLWIKQFGTTGDDYAYAVSADGLGNVYTAGSTEGDLGGPFGGGATDAYIAKYDGSGNHQWTRQISTTTNDVSEGVSADGAGNVYTSGSTLGELGGPNAGSHDVFVSKFDDSGNPVWTRQIGTAADDWGQDASADGLGGVYISGYTVGSLGVGGYPGSHDAFVSKFDANGDFHWTQQLGTAHFELGNAVSVDGLGSVYLSGYTEGFFDDPSGSAGNNSTKAFLAKYSDPPVPEPSSALLTLAALLGICTTRRPKRKTSGLFRKNVSGPIVRDIAGNFGATMTSLAFCCCAVRECS